jgi:hypothetical protein
MIVFQLLQNLWLQTTVVLFHRMLWVGEGSAGWLFCQRQGLPACPCLSENTGSWTLGPVGGDSCFHTCVGNHRHKSRGPDCLGSGLAMWRDVTSATFSDQASGQPHPGVERWAWPAHRRGDTFAQRARTCWQQLCRQSSIVTTLKDTLNKSAGWAICSLELSRH